MSRYSTAALSGAAAVFVLTSLFLGLPSIVYEANPGEFSWPYANIVARYWLWAVAIGAVLFLPSLVLPGRLARWWAAAVAVLSVYVWAHGAFQSHDFGNIDGREWSVDVPSWHIWAEAVAIFVGALPVLWLALRRQRVATGLMLFLAAGMAWQAGPTLLASRWKTVASDDEKRMGEVSAFSSSKNALIVLMDTMTGDVFEEVVAGSPELKAAFDGFVSFSDTVGVSPTTYLALPTIHSGQIYQNGQVLGDFFDETVREQSVLTKVAEAGYRSVLVDPIRGTCPRKVECLGAQEAMGGKKAALQSEASEILDAVLFRLAPLGVKSSVYNQGQWVVQKWTNDPRFVHRAVAGNSFLEAIAGAVSGESDAPTLKFIHLMTTHPPYVYQGDCHFANRELEVTRVNFALQVKCSLDRFALLLNELKRQDLYDQTAIMLISDHGNYQIASSRANVGGSWATKIASANLTFAIKPVGQRGEFRTADGEVHISDFGATLCDLTDACKIAAGVSALHAPTEGRARVFNDYRWKHEYWEAQSVPGLVRSVIHGPVGKVESWARDVVAKLGETIQFHDGGTSQLFTLIGWSVQEPWGTWTDGPRALLSIQVDRNLPTVLTVAAHGLVPNQRPTRARVLADGKLIGDITFLTPELKVTSFDLPDDVTLDGHVSLEFLVEDPVSPKEAGLSEDMRALGLGVHWLRLDAKHAIAGSN